MNQSSLPMTQQDIINLAFHRLNIVLRSLKLRYRNQEPVNLHDINALLSLLTFLEDNTMEG